MKKISKPITIINIISLILVNILMLKNITFIYSEYCFSCLKFITILVGFGALVSAVIELKNKNTLIGIFDILVCILTLPISFLKSSNYSYLFIPLIISIINFIILLKKPDKEKINVISIIAIVICTIIEIIGICMPIYYSNYNISSFEQALPQIQQLKIKEKRLQI